MEACRNLRQHAVATGVALFAALIIAGSDALPQTRTVKIVVPFPPGGGVDIVARLMADKVGRASQNNFVVENRPGAGTQIATESVARAAPDGSTLLFVANSYIINPSLRTLAYDPLTSFEPVCLLTRSPNVIVVNSASPYRSLAELVDAAHARPGALTMAFQGPGTSQHIGVEKLKSVAKLDMIEVPFTGTAPAVNAILGDHVAALFVNYPGVEQQVNAGKIRVLATASLRRIEALPDVPTIAEVVKGDVVEDTWTGSLVPAKTPIELVNQLTGWLHEAIMSAELRPKLAALSYAPAGLCGADFASFLRQQVEENDQVVRAAHIKVE